MTEKLFTVAGTATNPDGTTKARFANDLVARIKILNKSKCTDINLMELPEPMTKLQALQFLQAQGVTDGEAGYAVSAKLAEKSKVAKKGEVKIKAAKPAAGKAGKAVKPSLNSIRARKPAMTAEQVLDAVGDALL
jgi:hypothetical protein